jgi:hypothetical protein
MGASACAADFQSSASATMLTAYVDATPAHPPHVAFVDATPAHPPHVA